jgi:D-amino-acid dehydrogenase
MNVVIVGGGVIGLMCAYRLREAGYEVTVIDQTKGTDNCSFGNAGYIAPSHIIPLASPGVVAQGLRWMLSSTSPFYIKPRLSGSLIRWGWNFFRNATEQKVRENAPHLYNISVLSRELTIRMDRELDHGFELETRGCFMLYNTPEAQKAESRLAEEARKFGMEVPVLSADEVRRMEPGISSGILGGVYFPVDCHINPPKMMNTLRAACSRMGVDFGYGQCAENFSFTGKKITAVQTDNQSFSCDHLVLAGGSWLEGLGAKLGLSLPVQPGKGYSITYKGLDSGLKYPAILVDERVAISPFSDGLRIGGTMELGGLNHEVNMKRVAPIVHAANLFYPGLNLRVPEPKDVWAGLRPCTPDGLPYIGPSPIHDNVTIAGGHAMVGISLAAATGYLIRQIISGEKTEIPMDAFRVNR